MVNTELAHLWDEFRFVPIAAADCGAQVIEDKFGSQATSGMKVLVNGGINVSELDGWWAEAYVHDLGWARGDAGEHGGGPAWNCAEAEMLDAALENEVIPEFYSRDRNGIPTAWIARMRKSMARLTPRFSADRTVHDYTEQLYLPAAANYRRRAGGNAVLGKQIVEWRHSLVQKWAALRLGETKMETRNEQHVFEVQVYFSGLDPQAVQVELYADGVADGGSVCQEMTQVRVLIGGAGGYVYSATVSANRPPTDYTARIVPHFDGVAIPLEETRILWQR